MLRRKQLAAIGLVAVLLGGRADGESAQTSLPTGVWGGKGIQLTVTGAGATIDYGCDSGAIDQQPQTDAAGKFTATGTHAFGRGGPRRQEEAGPKPHKARYEGIRSGDRLQLSIYLPDLKRSLGEFTLEFGQRPSLERCG